MKGLKMRWIGFLVVLILACTFGAAGQSTNTISTVAAGGTNGSSPNGAYLPSAFGVVWDSTTGNTYISLSGYSIVYKIDPTGTTMTPYAGTGIIGFSGDGGPATSAQLDSPYGLAVDNFGDLFIADANNNRIREVDTKGIIRTVAGSGKQYNGIGFFGGYSGDGGPATGALLNFPEGVAVDKNGNLFIADSGNNLIRKVDNSPEHIITTYAGGAAKPCAGASDSIGDGCPATSALINSPTGVAVDSLDNVFIADTGDSVVRMVNTASPPIISTYAGSPANGCSGVLGDGGAATSASLCGPFGVFIDSTDTLYIADTFYNRIRKVDNTQAHDISTIAGNAGICLTPTGCGDGGSPTAATLNSPVAVGLNGTGAVLIGDAGSNRFRIATLGASASINNFAGGGTGGDSGAATKAVIGQPSFVSADSSGDLFVFDTDGVRIREVSAATQNITDFAGNGAVGPPGLANGDGGPALQANFTSNVHGMAFDPSGNLYVVDRGNFVVRKVSTGGTITLVAGTYGKRCSSGSCGDGGPATSALLGAPTGIAADSNGNVYIADGGQNRIRVVCESASCPVTSPTIGDIYNFAGTGTAGSTNGPASTATLSGPWGLAFDASGNLYVADAGNNLIREIDSSGNVTTYAFNGLPTFGGDGGAALSASMQFPQQVALDSAGNVFVGGGFDNVVRRIDTAAGTVITVAGDIHNLDGGFNGDGEASTQALISNFGLAIVTKNPGTSSASNTVYIADEGNNRIRAVTLAPVAAVSSTIPASFGPVLQGGASIPGLVTITNNGLDDLSVANVAAPAGFAISNLCMNPETMVAIPVAPGDSCLLIISLNPASNATPGPVSGNLTFNTNDTAHPSFTFAVAGTVVAAPGVALTVSIGGTGTGGVVSGSPEGVVGGNLTPISCPSSCTANYAAGEQVTLFAVPNPGFAVTSWNVSGPSGSCPVALTCTVTMSAAGTVTVTFAAASITVSGLGNGTGTIMDNQTPPLINCTYNGTTTSGTCTATYPSGTASVTLTAAPTGTSSFAGWLGFCGALGISGAGTGPCDLSLVVTIVPTLNGTQASAVFSGPAQTFSKGQVFVGTVDGMIFVYNANGTLSQVLNSGNIGGVIAGMNFDSTGNLYAANVAGNTVERFAGGTATPTVFGSGYNSDPLGLVIDPLGNVFVGQSSGQNTLLEFDSTGTKLENTFYPAYEQGGIGYLELLDDSARVLYTSGTQSTATQGTVQNYDIVNNHQNPDFAINLPGGPAFALRELNDKSVLVANATEIVHLDPNGNLLGAPSPYKPGGSGFFFALNLDPSGTSFWTGDALSGKVYQVQISTGTVLNTINTGLGFNTNALSFATIFGIAVFGQPQSGGADLAVTMTAPGAVGVNSGFNYSITVVNNGPLASQGVSLTDVFPAGVTVNSATTTQGTCTVGQTVSCNIGTLANGAPAVAVTINVTPTQAGLLNNTVTVNATTPDPNGANNSFTTSTTETAQQTTLTVMDAGTGSGTVTSQTGLSPAITCTTGNATGCSANFSSGTMVTLTAAAATGSLFGGFSNNCTSPNPQTNPPSCTLTIGTANVTVTATFNAIANTPALRISKSHSGNFAQGQLGAQYTVAVANASGAAPTTGTITVTEGLSGQSNGIASSFSGTSNPNGAWSYGQFMESTSAFTLLPANNAFGGAVCGLPNWSGSGGYPAVIANNTGSTVNCGSWKVPTNTLNLHPTNTAGTDSDVRWTAPVAGTYAINGSFSALDSTTTLDSVLVNGTSVFSTNISSTNTLATFSFVETLTAGSTLDFIVNCCSGSDQSFNFDSTGLTGTITNISSGLNLVSMSGVGWACGAPANPANVCARADALAAGGSYPSITVTVDVAASATSPQVNTVSVSGGGSAAANASDSTIITSTAAVLRIAKSHVGSFSQGQQGATYTVTVSNGSTAGPTSSTVTVTDTVPSGMSLVSMAGTDWTCGAPTNPANVCTRADALAAGASYPNIIVTVNVAANATSPQVNTVGLSGGGSASANASDSTTIVAVTPPALGISKSHVGNFTEGQQGAQYTVTVSNSAEAGSTSGTVTVTENVPSGLSLVSMVGTGWTCGTPNPANICTRTDALAGGAAYPAITVTVNVAANATSLLVNSVTVSGGGSASATANDATTITSTPVVIAVAPPPPGQPAVPTINPGGAATYGLVLTSQPGFSGMVTLSCTSSAPQFITCNPDPASVTITPGGTAQVAIVLNTFCSENAPLDTPGPGGPAGVLIVALTALALGCVTWMYRRRPRWVLTFTALTIAVYSIAGCGSTPKGTAGATPAGTYNLALSFRVNGGPPIPGPVLQLNVK